MKKIFKLSFAVCLCLLVIGAIYSFLTASADRDFKDCSVGVFNYDHSEVLCELTDEQRDEFVEILTEISLDEAVSYDMYSLLGMHYGYKIKLNNGKEMKVSIHGQYLNIDDETYLCELSESENIAKFAESAFKEYYPVKG